MFKNESHCMKEWIMHYLHHGVEHFYLINDNSTEPFMDILQEYIDQGIVTLFNVDEPYYLGRQRNLYNRHILPLLHETQWLLMIDFDEFIWSPIDIDLRNVLKNLENHGQIQFHESIFGSNGHIRQPKSLVSGFTKRMEHLGGKMKYFVNSNYEFSSLNVHHADFVDKAFMNDISKFIKFGRDCFVMNHYNCQSREFWDQVKCTRGDIDNFLTRTPDDFFALDLNEVEDLELLEQNRSILTDNADTGLSVIE